MAKELADKEAHRAERLQAELADAKVRALQAQQSSDDALRARDLLESVRTKFEAEARAANDELAELRRRLASDDERHQSRRELMEARSQLDGLRAMQARSAGR
jgi:hypothetical protein